VLVSPSPKLHCKLAIVPLPAVLKLVNTALSGGHPAFGVAEKFMVGFAYTVMYCVIVIVLLPLALVTVNVTVYCPGLKKLQLGFCPVTNVWPGTPKFQLHEVGFPVDKSVKCTTNGAHPAVVFAVKFADGCA
jgi:hypothetical protein